MAHQEFFSGFKDAFTLNLPDAPVTLAEGAGFLTGVGVIIGGTVLAARLLFGSKQ